MTETNPLDRLFAFVLAVAAEADDFMQRRLGPIHLLKYAYLADLAHAARHDGVTYSGTDWVFYHFGPWSEEAYLRIEPSMEAIGAEEYRIPSRYADDVVRFGLSRGDAAGVRRKFEEELPLGVTSAISRYIADHGSDTADLLRHVYLTPPMLAARPGERLNFLTMARERPPSLEGISAKALSGTEKKRRSKLIESARAEIKRRLLSPQTGSVEPDPPPRYDEIFFEGTAQLNRVAGESPTPSRGKLEFDDSIWISSQRREPDLP